MNPSWYLLAILWTLSLWAEPYPNSPGQQGYGQQAPAEQPPPEEASNFESEDALIDMQDALKSKQFVHRAILSTAIKDSSDIRFNRLYVNHLMGFNAIIQKGDGKTVQFAKFASGVQGLSVGFAFEAGHALEVGSEFSAVSSVYGGYRFFWRPKGFSVWPNFGFGAGKEMKGLAISQGPIEAQLYEGQTMLGYGTFGVLVPLLDVGIKVDLRVNLYGKDRIVITQGLGVIVFI